MMKIKITKDLKIKMLKALKDGYADTEDFKELQQPQVTIFELPDNGRKLTKQNDTDREQTI